MMGFPEALAIKALRETTENGKESVQRAAEWLLMHGDEEIPIIEEENKKEEKEEPQKQTQKRSRKRKIPIELQRLFAFLQTLDRKAISTKSLTESFGWRGNEIGQQHDVHELNRVLFEAIETSLKNTNSQDLLNKLYRGTLVNKVRCLTCGYTSEREEHFQDITAVVKNYSSLIYSLNDFVQPQLLDGENQYFCEQCNCKNDAKRWVCFRDIPPVLIFSLSRFEYDFITGNRKKNSDQFHYPLTIDMESYTEDKNSLLSSQNNDNNIKDNYKLAKELSLFEPSVNENSNYLYDLFTVIIHTGKSGNYGHYHAYIKDVLQEGAWIYKPDHQSNNQKNSFAGSNSSRKNHQRSASDDMNGPPEPSLPFLRDLEAISISSTLDLASNNNNNNNKENFSFDNENLPKKQNNSQNVTCQSNNNNNIQSNSSSSNLILPEIPPFSSTNKSNNSNSQCTNENSSEQQQQQQQQHSFPEDNDDQSGWFDFNDSSISPIPIKTLRSQFGGKSECAYMLVYRRRDSSIELEKSIVPIHLQIQAAEKNEQMEQKRIQKEIEANKIEIIIYPDCYFTVDEFGIARKINQTIKDNHHHHYELPKVTITMDRRQTLGEFKSHLKNIVFNDQFDQIKEKTFFHSMRVLQQRLVLPNPNNPFINDDKSLMENGISAGMEILMWDGSTIHNKSWNPFNQVLSINLYCLSVSDDSFSNPILIIPKESSKIRRPLDIHHFTFEITRNTSLKKLYSLIESYCGIESSKQKIFLFQSSSDQENLNLNCQLPNPYHHENITKPHDTDDDDEILLALSDFNITQNNCILTVEEQQQQQQPQMNDNENNLADEFLVLKNEMIQIKVKNNLNSNGLLLDEKIIDNNNHLFSLDFFKIPLFDVIIRQNCCLCDLKREILSFFNIPYDLDNVRFRKIRPEGFSSTLYQNEEISLSSIPIVNNSQMIIETGESPSSKTMKIQCKLSNADNLSDFDTNDIQSITICKDWTIRECIEKIKLELGVKSSDEKYVLRKTDLWGNITHTITDELHTAKQARINSGGTYVLSQPSKGGSIPVSLILFECNDREYPGFVQSSFCYVITDRKDNISFDLFLQNSNNDDGGSTSSASGNNLLPLDENWHIYSPALSMNLSAVPDSYSVTNLGSFYLDKANSLFQIKESLIRTVPLLAAANSPFHIRIWFNNQILKGHDKEFQSFYHSCTNPLTIQVLDHVEDLTDNIVCLTIFKRDSTNSRYLRPVEYLFDINNCKSNPLLTCLSIDFGIPKDSLQAFHFNVHLNTWKIVDSLSSSLHSSNHQKSSDSKMDLGELFTGASNSDLNLSTNQKEERDKISTTPYRDGGKDPLHFSFYKKFNFIYSLTIFFFF